LRHSSVIRNRFHFYNREMKACEGDGIALAEREPRFPVEHVDADITLGPFPRHTFKGEICRDEGRPSPVKERRRIAVMLEQIIECSRVCRTVQIEPIGALAADDPVGVRDKFLSVAVEVFAR
jgi:hypothetical protein